MRRIDIRFAYILCCVALIGLGARCNQAGTQKNTNTAVNMNAEYTNANSSAEGTNANAQVNVNTEAEVATAVVVPVEGYATHRTFKAFGEFISDRFRGYHVGDDVEVDDVNAEVPVYAVAGGHVVYSQTVSGYGGAIIIEHTIEGATYRALYGHVDLESAAFTVGHTVKKGEQIAVLGDHESDETDGERKHLHFSVYQGSDIRLAGYADTPDAVNQWINPQNFFSAYGVEMQPTRTYDPEKDLWGDSFHISFTIPEGMEVEYVPALDALNVFTLTGIGSARERSQLFIRYFDANQFLTLTTVNVLETTDTTVGDDYTAKQYVIQKKDGVADFADQPAWRNAKHTVTDFRGVEGQTRYYVVAQNPEMNVDTHQRLLDSMRISE